MGIIADATAIIIGGLFGERLSQKSKVKNYNILAISILMLSLVGFLENVYNVQGQRIDSENLLIVLFSFFVGSKIGEKLKIDERLSELSRTPNKSINALIDSTLFFGVGGLQISGPMILALNNDNSQLFIKALIDFPFAIAFGAAYGKKVSISALPVALIQILIAVVAYFSKAFFTVQMTAQLCSIGYIILFFSGFNLIVDSKYKINNINMIPAIFLVVLFNLIINVVEMV